MLKAQDHRLISELTDTNGDLDRPILAESWQVPAWVKVDGDRLLWDRHAKGSRPVQPKKGMFERFLDLAESPAEKIRAYAARWGVLKICEHGMPCTHNPPPYPPRSGNVTWCSPLGLWGAPSSQPWEPLEAWRSFSRGAFALLRISNRLMLGQTGKPEDWAAIYERSGQKAPWWDQQVEVEKILVAEVVNEWLTMGNVRPYVEWRFHQKRERPIVRFGGSSLFAGLALQLALAVGQADGWVVCVHCGHEYNPESRRPKSGQRNFCPTCRDAGIPTRYSLRDFRERSKHVKKTRSR